MPPVRSVALPASLLRRATDKAHRLLQYPVALANPNATLPLLSARDPAGPATATATATGSGRSMAPTLRRWVRDADELCVASVRRSESIHHLNSYVITYKLDDPQWQPLLLPQVHVLAAPPPPSKGSGAPPASIEEPAREVYIDYNKLVSLELMSRHANYALKHLVQRGHAMYFITVSQHSLLAMRGAVEASFVTCAFGVRGERLRTHIKHIGPLDVRDVLSVDQRTGRVEFDWHRPHVPRGVVATSVVEGYGTWFQRKPMLWQRSRRIGALQAQLGAFSYDLAAPESVGRLRDCEVSLLEPHIQLHSGSSAGAGAAAVGVIASSQVAQNDRMFVGQFEAPVIAAVDCVHQLAHRSGLHHRLLHPAGSAAQAADDTEALRQRLKMETLLPVSWTTRTPPPYVPLESDLPFKLQLSRPTLFYPKVGAPLQYVECSGSTVGTPFVAGVPLSMMEYVVQQGVDHYVYDDSPSARPMKWWHQKSNMPYNGTLYAMRSSLLDAVEPTEIMEHPLAAGGHRGTALRPTRQYATPASSSSRSSVAEQEGNAAEMLAPGGTYLVGHEDGAQLLQNCRHLPARPPLASLVPPNRLARRRAMRLQAMRNAKGEAKSEAKCPAADSKENFSETSRGAADGSIVLQRKRFRRRRRRREVPSDAGISSLLSGEGESGCSPGGTQQ